MSETQMDARPILLVGGGDHVVRVAARHGVRVVLLARTSDGVDVGTGDNVLESVSIDFSETEKLLTVAGELYRKWNFRRAVPWKEDALLLAALINDRLSLGGNSYRTSLTLKNKWLMRRRTRGTSSGDVRAELAHDVTSLREALREVGCPAIVKPVAGFGSEGIMHITSPEDVPTELDGIVPRGSVLLVEEFLPGPEYSVETFSKEGTHQIVAVTAKTTLPRSSVEIGHSVPADLSQDAEGEIRVAVNDFLDCVDFKEGPAHIELKLTPDGPRIIEGHDRGGGGRISDLVRIVTGTDLLAQTLLHAAGRRADFPLRTVDHGGAAVRFLLADPGIVESVDGVQEVLSHPAVERVALSVTEGEQVRPLRSGRDRVGHIVVRAESAAEAERLAVVLADRISILTK